MFAVLAVRALAVTGCGPESRAAPSATATLAVDARAKPGNGRIRGLPSCGRTLVRFEMVRDRDPGRSPPLLHRRGDRSSRIPRQGREPGLLGRRKHVRRSRSSRDGDRSGPWEPWLCRAALILGRTEGWIRRSFQYTLRSPEADEAVVRALLEAGRLPEGHLLRARIRSEADPAIAQGRQAQQSFGHSCQGVRRGRRAGMASPARCHCRRLCDLHDCGLLEHGADPNLTVAGGQDWTAFHVAAYMSRPDVIRLLLAHGANPHAATTSRKRTALHALAEGDAGPGAAESGHLLLDAGIDPILRDRKGRTPWDLVRARLKPECLAIAEPVVRTALARLQTATGG